MIHKGKKKKRSLNSNLKCSQLFLILRHQFLQMLQLVVPLFILFLTFMLDSHSTLENGILPHESFNLLLQHHIFLTFGNISISQFQSTLLIELRSYNNSFFGEEGKKLLANPYLHKVGVHKSAPSVTYCWASG